jgi:mono/diheme cytochrome c family protein
LTVSAALNGDCPELEEKIASKGKAMKEGKLPQHMIFGSAILLALFFVLTFLVVSIVPANSAPDNSASIATFRTKCAMCHGQDGGGSEVGKSMNVPDLRSPAVRKLPDVELAQVISNGKGGMPSFKNSLSADQIHGLVTYVRLLHHPVLILRGREGTL